MALDSDSRGNDNNNNYVKKALIIAVSDYDVSSGLKSIAFCKNDGQEVYNILIKNGYDIPDNRKLIGHVDSSKLKEIIYDFFTDESNNPDDTLVFYYSGHGVPDKFGKTFLAPSNMHSEHPFKRGFSFDDLTDVMLACNSLRVVTILDSCFSGSLKIGKGLGDGFNSKSSEEAAVRIANRIVEEKSDKLKQGIGRCLLASSQGYEEAYDRQEKDHSVFTYYLLEGLRGSKNAVDDEGNVTYDTLGKFIAREMGNLPPDKRPRQTPVRKGEVSGGDIVLAQYPKLKKFRIEEFEPALLRLLRNGQIEEFNSLRKEVPTDVLLDFSGQNLYGVQISRADLSSINLINVNLFNADLEGANLTNANLLKADLEGANLHGIVAINAIMESANLTETNLTKANLKNANLTNANLTKSKLYRANLVRTKLVGADLRDADITESNIREADVTGAIFRHSSTPTGTTFDEGSRSSGYRNNSSDGVTEDTANRTNYFSEERPYDRDQRPGDSHTRVRSHLNKAKDKSKNKDTRTPLNSEYTGNQTKISVMRKIAISGTMGATFLSMAILYISIVMNPSTTIDNPLEAPERVLEGQNSTDPPTTTNTPPKVFDSSVMTTMNQPVSIQLKASDGDTNTDLTATIVSQPSNGRLSEIDQDIGTVTYTPNSGFNGSDAFTFKAFDGQVSSENDGRVTVTVS